MDWALEERLLLAVTPVVAMDLPQTALLNESFTFPVTFSNQGNPGDVGYGPYAQLIVPPAGPDTQQVKIDGATFAGVQVPSKSVTFDASGKAFHPLLKDANGQPQVVTGPAGGTLVVMQLPFGSFAPEQPPIQLTVQAEMLGQTSGVLGKLVPIQAGGGFFLGTKPLDDPKNDPPIVASPVTRDVTPTILQINKDYLGPEGETATGPNFPQTFRLTINVADGQTVNNLDIADLLPPSLQFVSASPVLVHGAPSSPSDIISSTDPSTTTPGGLLERVLRRVVGTTANSDVRLDFRAYVPEFTSNDPARPILDPSTGQPTGPDVSPIPNTGSARGQWQPATGGPVDLPATTDDATVQPRSLAIQKTVADVIPLRPGITGPGDTLEYTIRFQVSDFFSLNQLSLTDILGDGQSIDTTFTPTLQVAGQPAYGPANFSGTNFVTTTQPDGTINVAMGVSSQLIDSGLSGTLTGGRVGGTFGPTTGVITFRTKIDPSFRATGEPVTEGDHVGDRVSGTARVDSTGNFTTDTSSSDVTITLGQVQKSIYSVNGVPVTTPNPLVAPGDVVTFRLTQAFPLTSYQTFNLTDFLPLPIFNIASVNPGSFFQVKQSSASPPANTAWYGPSNTLKDQGTGNLIQPTVTTDTNGNSVTMGFPAQNQNISTTLDVLFSVVATDTPFADQLLLTNQGASHQVSTTGVVTDQNTIAQIVSSEPFLTLTKGIVSARAPEANATPSQVQFFPASVGPVAFALPGNSGPSFTGTVSTAGLAATPITSDVRGVQAGDLVKFALVVQNTGTGKAGAFNVVINDVLPPGFAIPTSALGLNLQVADGAGSALAYVDLGGGLFGSGLRLIDNTAATEGSLAPVNPTSGRNLAIVTFDLVVASSMSPNFASDNLGRVPQYTSSPTGTNFLAAPLQDKARATSLATTMVKSLSDTSESFTTGPNLAIGEVGLFSIALTVPQGTLNNARIVDSLPAGQALVSIENVTANSPALTTSRGSFTTVKDTASVGTGGQQFTLDFATLLNTDLNDSTSERITILYRAVVLDVPSNTNGARLQNTARLTYDGGSSQASASINAVVPKLNVTKTINNPVAQARETVTYTIVIAHDPSSGTDAFNVQLNDIVPAGVTYVPGSFRYTAGVAPSSLTDAGGTLQALIPALKKGQTTTLQFQAVVVDNIQAFQTVTNTAGISYITLPNPVPAPISPYNPNSHERIRTATGSASFSPSASISKSIVATSLPDTIDNQLTIGEVATFQIRIRLPRGSSPAAQILDTMPAGLALVSLDSITADPLLSTDLPGGFGGALGSATINTGGIGYSLNLGNVTNAAQPSDSPQFVTLTFKGVVLNLGSNQSGTTLQNGARFQSQLGGVDTTAPIISVVSPGLGITKTASSPGADRNVPVTFTIVVSATGTATAFDALVKDVLPSGFTYVAGSFKNTAGLAPTSIDTTSLTASFSKFPVGQTSTFTLQASPVATVNPGDVLTNTVNVTGGSLPGDPGQISPYNPSSTRRTVSADASASVTIRSNSLAGSVYLDYNNDGIRGSGEPGINGVTVTLVGTPTSGAPISVTASTDSAGNFQFTGLPAGTYTVTEDRASLGSNFKGTDQVGTSGTTSLPAGALVLPTSSTPPSSAFTSVPFFVGQSATATGYNFGELPPGSLAGNVSSDVTPSAIPGVTINLAGVDYLGNPVSQGPILTDAGGNYRFAGLPPGTYAITETQPAGFAQGANTAGTLSGSVQVSPPDVIKEIVVGAANQVQQSPPARYDGTGYNFGELVRADNVIVKETTNRIPGPLETWDYTLTVTNNGPSTSLGTVVTDTLDPAISFISATPPDNVTVSGRVITWTIGTLPVGDVRTLTIHVGWTNGDRPATPIPNTAVVTSQTPELYPLDNVSTVEVTPTSLLSGTYFVDYNADGQLSSFDLPLGGQQVTLTDGQSSQQTSTSTGPLTLGHYLFGNVPTGDWTLTGNLPAAGSGYTYYRSIPGALYDATNTGTPTGVANGNSINSIVLPVEAVLLGLNYNFTVMPLGSISGSVKEALNSTSPGNLPIAGVTMTLTGTTWDNKAVAPIQVTTDALGNYRFNGLVPGAYTIVESQPSGFLSGLVQVGDQGGSTPDPNTITQVYLGPPGLFSSSSPLPPPPANKPGFVPQSPTFSYNSAVNNFNEYRLVDLAIAKGVDNPHPEIGSTVVYTITVSNIGPGVATGVIAQDLLPPGMVATSATETLGTFEANTGIWTIGTLKGTVDFPDVTAPASATLTLTAIVPPPTLPLTAPYILTNIGIVKGNEPELSLVNNTDTAQINPLLADIQVVKRVDNDTPNKGDTITYTVAMTNNGPNSTDGVVVQDVIPNGLSLVPGSVVTTTGSYDPTTGNWLVGIAPVGVTYTLTFQTVVTTYDPVDNVAEVVASRRPDPDPSNDRSDASIVPLQPALTVNKTVIQNPTPLLTQIVRYALTITNVGLGTAVPVVLEEQVPSQLTYVSSTISDLASNPVSPPSGGSYDPVTGIWNVGVVRSGEGYVLQADYRQGSTPLESLTNTVKIKDPTPTTIIDSDQATINPLGIITGRLFWDQDGNRQDSPTDPGISSVSVLLSGVSASGLPFSQTSTTDADGNYRFLGIPKGSWTVSVVTAPAGYFREVVLPGTLGGAATTDSVTSIPVSGSLVALANNFGFVHASSLSGYVLWDLDHNRLRGTADFGLANVTVALVGVDFAGRTQSYTTRTDTNGHYDFVNLPPGTYRVTEGPTPPFVHYGQNPGTAGGMSGSGAGNRRSIVEIPLGQNVTASEYNFFELKPRECHLRQFAVEVGSLVHFLVVRRSINPTRFDHHHPRIAPDLQAGRVPRALFRAPEWHSMHNKIPTLGTKRIVIVKDPVTGKPTYIGIPNKPIG